MGNNGTIEWLLNNEPVYSKGRVAVSKRTDPRCWQDTSFY